VWRVDNIGIHRLTTNLQLDSSVRLNDGLVLIPFYLDGKISTYVLGTDIMENDNQLMRPEISSGVISI
jgi:hypothetical protein